MLADSNGTQLTYFTVERDDKYFRSRGQWIYALHDAAFMTEDLAIKVAKRYPGSTVEKNFGYGVHFKTSLADVGEPETQAAIASVVKLAKADGWSWETLAVQIEKAFHANQG